MAIFTVNLMHVGLGFVIMRSCGRVSPNNSYLQALQSDTAYLCHSCFHFFRVINKLRADGLFKTSRLHFHSVGCPLCDQLVTQDSLLAVSEHERIGKESKYTDRFVVILILSKRRAFVFI